MDSETAFTGFGQDGSNESTLLPSSAAPFFRTNLAQRIGMIGSAVVLALGLITILYLLIKIRRKDRQRDPVHSRVTYPNGGRMFDKNIEMVAGLPYSRKTMNKIKYFI